MSEQFSLVSDRARLPIPKQLVDEGSEQTVVKQPFTVPSLQQDLLSLMEQDGLLIHNTAGDRYVANMEI